MDHRADGSDRHEAWQAGVGWMIFGCIALSGLAVQGEPALFWLVPVGVLLAVVHVVPHRTRIGAIGAIAALERTIRTRRAWLAIHEQVRSGATWEAGHCTWCGATVRHRGPDGVVQVPAVFHQNEITVEVGRRAAL